MTYTVIDRRKNAHGKSTNNRRKFVKRVKEQVREAIKKTIRDGNITDIINNKDKKIKIPGKGLAQPTFHHNSDSGSKDYVNPGNKKFNQGDKIPRPPCGGGENGQEGSAEGISEDDFTFNLTKDEFLDLFFEDLELPDMIKKDIIKTDEYVNHRAGFSVDGNPSRLNIIQSMKKAKGRKLGLRSSKKQKLKKLEEELALIKPNKKNKSEILRIEDEIKILKLKIKAIPFIDDVDLLYNRWEKVMIPTTQAVMFGIMDCSASMGEWEKEMAKRFFMLMLLFLHYNYERVDIIWIRHHINAKEVDEQEFFHSQESGGTIVSSALHLMKEIIEKRYPLNNWNIFGCQISDGDNWGSDNNETCDIMSKYILPNSQFFSYVEVDPDGTNGESDLWPHYETLKNIHKNFEIASISDVTEIYPIFRRLFEKK